jgi:TolA-binding protein
MLQVWHFGNRTRTRQTCGPVTTGLPIPMLYPRQKTTTTMTRKARKEMEDVDGLNTAIKSKQQVMEYLMAGDYIMPDKSIDLCLLAHILLQFGITNKLPKPITHGIRAIAFLIEDAHNQQIADNIAGMVKLQLSEQAESFNSDVEAMRGAVEHVMETVKTITKKIDKFNNRFQETADQLVQATQELTEKATEPTNTENRTTNQSPTTHATATQQCERNEHAEVIARGETTDKQILIQRKQDTETNADNPPTNLTEKELVTKANTALDLMGWEGLDKLQHTTFVAARKLCNGDVIYQVNTPEAAEWIQQGDIQEAFMRHYNGTSTI